jgi:hypothetical protein
MTSFIEARQMSRIFVIGLAALLASTAAALPASAQSSSWYSLEREELRWRSGLWTLPEIRHEKDREARAPEWAWLLTGNIAAGHDSNIFEGPVDETGSTVLDAGLRAELRRYITSKDRIRIWAQATAIPFKEESEPNDYRQWLGMQYRHTRSNATVFHVFAEVKHENDNVVNTEGEDPERDFEHVQYRAVPSMRYKISSRDSVWLAYHMVRRDYSEQVNLGSLDYWLHGPSIRWRRIIGKRSDLELDYAFRIQDYDEESARNSLGVDVGSTEEHFFHRLQAEYFWRPYSRLEFDVGYEFEIKDDRFQGFESWNNHKIIGKVTWAALPRVKVRAAAAYDNRDYDHRNGDVGTLEYDKFTGEFAAGYDITTNVTPYIAYKIVDRNTNLNTGNEFRDYEIKRFSVGVAFTY